MKQLILILLSLFSLLHSCNEDEVTIKNGCFSALIDGVLHESNDVSGTFNGHVLILGGTVSSTNKPTIALYILTDEEGEYEFKTIEENSRVIGLYRPQPLTNATLDYSSTSGIMNIEHWKHNQKQIQGTFNFEGVNEQSDTISVTEGEFSIWYE